MSTQTTTREKPIVFPSEDVRAILAGRMTQTRRLINMKDVATVVGRNASGELDPDAPREIPEWQIERLIERCPYGQPGDRLWVTETWATMCCYDYLKPSQLSVHCGPWIYRADGEKDQWDDCGRWRFAISMPRFVSRISLEITGVGVEVSHGGWWVIEFRRIEA